MNVYGSAPVFKRTCCCCCWRAGDEAGQRSRLSSADVRPSSLVSVSGEETDSESFQDEEVFETRSDVVSDESAPNEATAAAANIVTDCFCCTTAPIVNHGYYFYNCVGRWWYVFIKITVHRLKTLFLRQNMLSYVNLCICIHVFINSYQLFLLTITCVRKFSTV